MSEWLKVMLEEVRRKQAERAAGQSEHEQREQARAEHHDQADEREPGPRDDRRS